MPKKYSSAAKCGDSLYYVETKHRLLSILRAVARSENLGGHVILGGDNVPPLVEIGLTDLTKSGGARAPPAPPLATGLSK